MKTTYTATDPTTGVVFTRSTARAYAFAVIVTDNRRGIQWAEWAARRDLAEKNAAHWASLKGVKRIGRGYNSYPIDHGAGFDAIIVDAIIAAPSGRKATGYSTYADAVASEPK